MSKILLSIRNILLISTIITIIAIKNSCAKFIIERNEIGSDRFIKIDGADEVEKDESTFKADGTCLDSRRNIASAITDPTTRCYTNTAMKYIGNSKKLQHICFFIISNRSVQLPKNNLSLSETHSNPFLVLDYYIFQTGSLI